MKAKLAHIFDREEHGHYVEPEWCSRRLFEAEQFDGPIWDPCCGFGRIPEAARAAGYFIRASDIVDRGYEPHPVYPGGGMKVVRDFFDIEVGCRNIVGNPPFHIFEKFAQHALKLADKVALLWIVPRLNAAGWLQGTPLARVWLLTPRPSMPPGHVISAGGKVSGDTRDFCWLIWDKAHVGPPELKWLRRDA